MKSQVNRNFNIHNLSHSLEWWLNFLNSVGRNYVVSESTLKLPIAEYLETINKDELELEYNHPVFSSRRIDLFFKDLVNNQDVVFEFKYINQKSTLRPTEKQRILDDLLRLKLFNSQNKKTYFLICGNTAHFNQYFQKVKTPSKKMQTHTSENRWEGYGFYNKWFSFDTNKRQRTIDLGTKNKNYSKHYEDFKMSYLLEHNKKHNTNIQLPFTLETELIYLSKDLSKEYTLSGIKLGVWEIK